MHRAEKETIGEDMKIRYECLNTDKNSGKVRKGNENKRGSAVIRAAALGVALAVAPGLLSGCKSAEKDKIEQTDKSVEHKKTMAQEVKPKEKNITEKPEEADDKSKALEKECLLEIEKSNTRGIDKAVVEAMLSEKIEEIDSPDIKEALEHTVTIEENLRKLEELSECIEKKKIKQDAEKEFISAAWDRDVEKLKELLNEVSDIDVENAHGENALSISCFMSSFEAVKFLVENGAKIDAFILSNAVSFSGNKVFEYIMQNGGEELIKKGEDQGVLIDAVMRADKEKVKAILDAGADVNYKDSLGNTALSVASDWDYSVTYKEIMKLLEEAGAKE